jgi:hypothetical protein
MGALGHFPFHPIILVSVAWCRPPHGTYFLFEPFVEFYCTVAKPENSMSILQK